MRIGVLCSGGDAPGMNACLRAVVRAAVAAGHEIVGIRRGYDGLLNESFWIDAEGEPLMSLRSVGNLLKAGGTILHSSRSEKFRTTEGLEQAAEILRRHEIDALVPIGGDGTFRGALDLAEHWSGQIVGCPGTIDNDLLGTDYTIGFQTAVATAVEAVDKLRDTAESHERLFLVEVMGRHSGCLAVYTALAAGAEFACIPETPTDIDRIIEQIRAHKQRGKSSIMLIVAEGDEAGGAAVLHERLQRGGCPFPSRMVILGHLQRGGSPIPEDRILASRLGVLAVEAVLQGKTGLMAGEIRGEPALTPFPETYAAHKPIPAHMLELIETLSI